jgi:superfamily II DNA or RNA helicase
LKTCTVIIHDEVNVSVKGLDLDTRRALVKRFKYFDPTARFRPAYKLGRWDGYTGFFGIGGSTYLPLMGEVLEYLDSENYHIELQDHRDTPALQFDAITTEFWSHKTWPSGHRFAGQPIEIRPDQVEVVNKFLQNPQSIQCLSTGFGKTIVCAALCKSVEKYGRTITIVPNKSLVEQTEQDYTNCGLDVGVYYGDRKQLGKMHTICTWQSMNVLVKNKIQDSESQQLDDFLHDVKTVIVDEVHTAKAQVLQKLLTQHMSNASIRWGMTGTIPKQDIDFMSLRVSLGDVVHTVAASDLQDQGILSSCHVKIVQTQEWREFKSYAEELKYLVTDDLRMEYAAKMIHEISKSGNTLVLVDRLECGRILQEKLRKLYQINPGDPDVPFISGVVKTADRTEEYQEINISDNRTLLATYGTCAVGINLPRLFNLVLVEPGKSFVRVIQSIGRGLRKANDKDHVNIVDFTANTKYAKKHLTERKRFYNEARYPYTITKVDCTNQ